MAKQRSLRFPNGFLWGTASSSFQNEGGNTNSQWSRWERQGHIVTGERSRNAADWWPRAEQDFELAEQMENNALRLSIEWSRVEPAEGRWESAAIDRYREMLQDLRKRHMKPVVTLHHFTEPLWFAERGGFATEANLRYFLRYVARVVEALRDLCDFWLTINEPNVYATQGYLLGSYPPGEHDTMRAFQVLRNLMQAHVAAFYTIRRIQPQDASATACTTASSILPFPSGRLIAPSRAYRKPFSTGRPCRLPRRAVSRSRSARFSCPSPALPARVTFMASTTTPARWSSLTRRAPPNSSGIATRGARPCATTPAKRATWAKFTLSASIASSNPSTSARAAISRSLLQKMVSAIRSITGDRAPFWNTWR